MTILTKYWKQILIGLIVLLFLLYIYFQGKKSGKKGQSLQVDVPLDVVIGGNVAIDGTKVRQIATELHNDMDGYNWQGHDEEIYNRYSQLSDSEFISVYNDFNTRYFNEGEGTLFEWIDNETYVGYWDVIENVILPRMAALNLN
jgi:hypothetical protein